MIFSGFRIVLNLPGKIETLIPAQNRTFVVPGSPKLLSGIRKESEIGNLTVYPLLGGSFWVVSSAIFVYSALILGGRNEAVRPTNSPVAIAHPQPVHSDGVILGFLEGTPVRVLYPGRAPPTVEDSPS